MQSDLLLICIALCYPCSCVMSKYTSLPPASLGQGNVLHLPVILFTGEVSAPLHAGIHTPLGRHLLGRHPLGRRPQADTPLDRHPLGRHPIPSDTTGYGQQADGMHPTGMHTCVHLLLKGVI